MAADDMAMKILIIEDNEKLAGTIKKGFEQEGYAADCLFDGAAGERRVLARHKDYDCIVLDIMLPKRSGIEICKAMRANNIVTPVLMLTAKDSTEDIVAGLNSGADDYLVKPFSFDELVARIKALLRRPPAIVPSALSCGPLVLNSATRQVLASGQEIILTLKEFGILEFFMRHPNQVMTREQILNHAWDFAFDSLSNVVDVQVKNLRKKINGRGAGEILETIRGVGYRLKG